MALIGFQLCQNAFEMILDVVIFDVFVVQKWNVGDHLKRVLAKFEAERSRVRGVNGRSKFPAALRYGATEH